MKFSHLINSQESHYNCCHQIQILRLKYTKIDFGWGSAPDHAGGAYSAHPAPCWNKGQLLLKMGVQGEEGEERDRKAGGKRERNGGEGKRVEETPVCIFKFSL